MLRLLTRLVIFLLVLVVVAAALVGVGAWLAPQRVTAALVEQAAEHGATLTLPPLELTTRGALRSASVTLQTNNATVSCQGLTAHPAWRSLLSEPRARLVEVEECRIVRAAPAGTSHADEAAETSSEDPVARTNALLSRLRASVDRLEVTAIHLGGDGELFTAELTSAVVDAEAVHATWRFESLGWRATGALAEGSGRWVATPSDISAPALPLYPTLLRLCDEGCSRVSVAELTLMPGPAVAARGIDFRYGALRLAADIVENAPAAERERRATVVTGLHLDAPASAFWAPIRAAAEALASPDLGQQDTDDSNRDDSAWVAEPHARARRAVALLTALAPQIPTGPFPELELRDTRVSVGFFRSIALPDVAIGSAPTAPGAWTLAGDGATLRVTSPEDARPALSLHVSEREARLSLDATGLTVTHPGLAETPVLLPASALTLSWLADAPTRVELTGHVDTMPFGGHLDVSEHALTFEVQATSAWGCQRLWRSVPVAMLAQLTHDDIQLTGSLTPSVRLHVPVADLANLELDVEGLPGDCVPTRIAERWDPEQLNEASYQMTPSESVMPTRRALGPGTPDYVSLEQLPAYVPALMYLSEEINFPTNEGFSEGLIARGLRANLEGGRYVYGGSTVSQQLVKNLFLRRDKTLGRKIEEAMLTWLMERSVPKWRILELYLNMIEFGPDVWGIAPASWHYFGRPADALTPLEAAFLAALKPSPREGNVYRRRGHSPIVGWWPERLQTLLERLHEHGAFLSLKEAQAFAPYVVALRRDDATDGDSGPVLGTEDGSVTRIEARLVDAPPAWWSLRATP